MVARSSCCVKCMPQLLPRTTPSPASVARVRIVELDWQAHAGRMPNAGNARHRWQSRQGVLVRAHGADGRIGWGEASPLPGYSPDDLATATESLRRWSSSALPATLDLERPLGPQLEALLGTIAAPSARCAVETALLDLAGQVWARPIWWLLRYEDGDHELPEPVPLCGLIMADEPRAAMRVAVRLRERGLSIAKLKIGRPGALDADLALIDTLQASGLQLRLDANGSLPVSSLATTLDRLRALDPLLIEEPVPAGDLLSLARHPEVARGSESLACDLRGLPLGLDESLRGASALRWIDQLAARGALEAIVLKPMALGGLLPCMALARHAAQRGVGSIASHLFDGPVALAAAAHLALALPTPVGRVPLACGLDRHPGLDAWPPLAPDTTTDPLLGERAILAGDRPGLGIAGETWP